MSARGAQVQTKHWHPIMHPITHPRHQTKRIRDTKQSTTTTTTNAHQLDHLVAFIVRSASGNRSHAPYPHRVLPPLPSAPPRVRLPRQAKPFHRLQPPLFSSAILSPCRVIDHATFFPPPALPTTSHRPEPSRPPQASGEATVAPSIHWQPDRRSADGDDGSCFRGPNQGTTVGCSALVR